MKFKKGQLIFFNYDNLFSKCIRVFNRLKYGEEGWTHIGIITDVRKDAIQIHEALSQGFIKSWYGIDAIIDWEKNHICEVKTLKIPTKNIEEFADKYLGRPYAWYDILGIFLSSFLGFRILKITGSNKLICSEAIARVLYDLSNKKIDFEKEYDKHYDLITPMDIYLSKQL